MDKIKLPTELAQEPYEEACQPLCENTMSGTLEKQHSKKCITFAEATQSSEKSASQNSCTYKEVLSQPAAGITHRQRLLWLQQHRSTGLWVQCDDCHKWRYLSYVLDSHALPEKWMCCMNPDINFANCSTPEARLRVRDEEDLIHGEYSAGSIVWARITGWPWWPAMVDDCPDTEQYYWLDGFSDIPTHYNVVFFDAFDVTRAWVAPEQLKPYSTNKSVSRQVSKDKKHKKRMEIAIKQANDAKKLTLPERLTKYSFIARYPGAINRPKKITKHEVTKFQNKLKRKYNIAFPDESFSESEDEAEKEETMVIKKNNVILLGTPKHAKEKKSRTSVTANKNDICNTKKMLQDSFVEICDSGTDIPKIESHCGNNAATHEVSKQLDSMAVQIGSSATVTSTLATNSIDNDTSKTYAPETELLTTLEAAQNIRMLTSSPKSDDFDF